MVELFTICSQNTRALQSVKTASCGNYAIMYLLCKAQGESMDGHGHETMIK